MQKKFILIIVGIILALLFYFISNNFFNKESEEKMQNTNTNTINTKENNKNEIYNINNESISSKEQKQFTCNNEYELKEGVCIKYIYVKAIKNISCKKGIKKDNNCILYSNEESDNYITKYYCEGNDYKLVENKCQRIYKLQTEKDCIRNGGNVIAGNCVISLNANKTVICLDKDYTYNIVKDKCLKLIYEDPIVSYSCPNGYILDNDKCYIIKKEQPIKNY